MKFKFPHLKGYVTLENGEIVPHGDPELIYMKDLIKKAENVKKFWEHSTKPEPPNQQAIELEKNLGFAYKRFSQRVLDAMTNGKTIERRRELWEGWIKHHLGEAPKEIVDYFMEKQEYDILKEA